MDDRQTGIVSRIYEGHMCAPEGSEPSRKLMTILELHLAISIQQWTKSDRFRSVPTISEILTYASHKSIL